MSSGPDDHVGWWRARFLKRASRADFFVFGALLVLAAAVVGTGRRAASAVPPHAVAAQSRFVDDIDVPLRLPNAPLRSGDGATVSLYELATKPHTVVAFYAPWCRPCQEELPDLARRVGPHAGIVVVIDRNEDLEHTRRQLANIDATKLGFYVDVTEQLTKEGRVSALPTTYVISPNGTVQQRTRGYSSFAIYMLARKVRGTDPFGGDD